MKRADIEASIGQYVWVLNGWAREPDLAIVLGYGYRQRHGPHSPVEPDWTSRSGGSQALVALRDAETNTWTAAAVHLMRIHPYRGEPT